MARKAHPAAPVRSAAELLDKIERAVARQVEVDAAEVVFAGPANDDRAVFHNRAALLPRATRTIH